VAFTDYRLKEIMEVWDDTKGAVDPVVLARRSGMTKKATRSLPGVPRPQLLTQQLSGCCGDCATGLRGLGFILPDGFNLGANVPSAGSGNISVLNSIAAGVSFIPGLGQIASVAMSVVNGIIGQFESWLGIGAGRREADLIVPVQNGYMERIGGISIQLYPGQDPSLDVLYRLYRETWMSTVAFLEFVLMKTFTDRRASGQALNTIMPYIDGTCGYAVPIGPKANPSQVNCPLPFGEGISNGGMLADIQRRILEKGGIVQVLPTIQSAANDGYKLADTPPPPTGTTTTIMGLSTPVAVGIGALALYFFSGRTRG
jgi:hypothetical protein